MPDGVDLDDPTDTASLYARAGQDRRALTRADSALRGTDSLQTSVVPPGTPTTRGLTQHVVPSCSGTGSDGKRVQPVYVREASTTSRYTAVLPLLRNEIATIDDVFSVSAAKTGGVRRVRWVHQDCVPVVLEVVVPDGTLSGDFWATVSALKSAGLTDKSRKYLAFAEANDLCGVGTLYQDGRLTGNNNDGVAASYARVDTSCWSTPSYSVPAHELTHNLGGVLETAPNATTYGHCDDEADLMCYDDGSGIPMRSVCASLNAQLLDCNRDDYFSTAPTTGSFLETHWNRQLGLPRLGADRSRS